VNFVTFEHRDSSGGIFSIFLILPYYTDVPQIYRFGETIYIFLKNIVKMMDARFEGGWTGGLVNPLASRKNDVSIMEILCIFWNNSQNNEYSEKHGIIQTIHSIDLK